MYEIDEKLSTDELISVADASKNMYSKYYAYHHKAMEKGSNYAKGCIMDVADKRWASTPCSEYKCHLAKELDQNNYAYGSYKLSLFYTDGTGTDQDFDKAFYYAQRASDLNNYYSIRLSLFYLQREVTDYNPEKALKLVEGSDDYEYIKRLCELLNLNEENRKLKARDYTKDDISYAFALYNSLSSITEDEDLFNYAAVLNDLGGYSRIDKAYQYLLKLKERNYINNELDSLFKKVKKKYFNYRPQSLIGINKTESIWHLDTLIEERTPHFWQLFNEINTDRNSAYFARAQWLADWLVYLYPDSALAKLCAFLAYACVTFENNSRFFNIKFIFTELKNIKYYDCINEFNGEDKNIVLKLFNAIEQRNTYNKNQLNDFYGNRTYWSIPYPVFMVSGKDDKAKQISSKIKKTLNNNNQNCYYQNDSNLLRNAIGPSSENAARINEAETIIFVLSSTDNIRYDIWNYGDYYTRDKSAEYGKRLIIVGPANKEESLCYRFKADYFIDIDDADINKKILTAVEYLKGTRDENYSYRQINSEVVKKEYDDIDKCLAYYREYCIRHDIKYCFPEAVYKNSNIFFLKTQYSKNNFVIDILNNKALKFEIAVKSLFNSLDNVYYELKLYDIKMNLTASNSEYTTVYNNDPRYAVARLNISTGNDKINERTLNEGLYFVEIECYKGPDSDSKFLGKVLFPVCLKYWMYAGY
ncbi:MAG: hypothetical protein ACI4WM_03445 [Erysipelotrichaceae bacterium]